MKRGTLVCSRRRINSLSNTDHRIWNICGNIIMKSSSRRWENDAWGPGAMKGRWRSACLLQEKSWNGCKAEDARSPREHGPRPDQNSSKRQGSLCAGVKELCGLNSAKWTSSISPKRMRGILGQSVPVVWKPRLCLHFFVEWVQTRIGNQKICTHSCFPPPLSQSPSANNIIWIL